MEILSYLNETDSQNLIKEAKKGSKEAFAEIISQYKTSIYRITKSILRNDADCADSIQETIIKAYLNLKNLRDETQIKTWLLKIAVNESKRFLKKKSKKSLQLKI